MRKTCACLIQGLLKTVGLYLLKLLGVVRTHAMVTVYAQTEVYVYATMDLRANGAKQVEINNNVSKMIEVCLYLIIHVYTLVM